MSSKRNIKIYRKYSDFYSAHDIAEKRSPEPNLTIDNFDNKGFIKSPRAPCVAVTIDPDYIKDTSTRPTVRKFLIKSDILKLREITRTKFFFYTNKQRAIENDCEEQVQNQIYVEMKTFYEFCFKRLKQFELNAFNEMHAVHKQLEDLQNSTYIEELKILELEHQKIYMEVSEEYRRFRYYLKLINYFDNVSEDGENIEKFNDIINSEMSEFLDSIPEHHSPKDAENLLNYMETLIKPYLLKRNYLNVELWQRGYESIRRKMFCFNRHLTRVAMMNHIISIIYDKFMKSHQLQTRKIPFRRNANFLCQNAQTIQSQTLKTFDAWQVKHKEDKLNVEIEGVVQTLLNELDQNESETDSFQISHNLRLRNDTNIVDKIGIIQDKVLGFLSDLDYVPSEFCLNVEKKIRHQIARDRDMAKKALITQTRFQNLLNHYRSHLSKKNIADGYITLIPKLRRKLQAKRISPLHSADKLKNM